MVLFYFILFWYCLVHVLFLFVENYYSQSFQPHWGHAATSKRDIDDPKYISEKEIDWKHAVEIGHGSFGIVYKARYFEIRKMAAIKKLNEAKFNSKHEAESKLKREAGMCFFCCCFFSLCIYRLF